MSGTSALLELKQIVGALIFGSKHPITVREIRKCLTDVADEEGGETAAFGEVVAKDIRDAIQSLGEDLARTKCGFMLREVGGGFRVQSDPVCGVWLKRLLNTGRPQRLSQPALETLAIIAYRQPVMKSTIEGVRGVGVDHMIKTLMELQLVRIVGRSDLPGRPFLYGTTQTFLEHFGLKNVKELDEIEPMLRQEASAVSKVKQAVGADGTAAETGEDELPFETGFVEARPVNDAVVDDAPSGDDRPTA